MSFKQIKAATSRRLVQMYLDMSRGYLEEVCCAARLQCLHPLTWKDLFDRPIEDLHHTAIPHVPMIRKKSNELLQVVEEALHSAWLAPVQAAISKDAQRSGFILSCKTVQTLEISMTRVPLHLFLYQRFSLEKVPLILDELSRMQNLNAAAGCHSEVG